MELAKKLSESYLDYLPPNLLDKASQTLGLPVDTARTGIMAAIPAIMQAIQGKIATPDGARNVMNMIREQGYGELQPGTQAGAQGIDSQIEKGKSLLSGILGGSTSSILGAITSATGVGGPAASGLMGLASSAAFTFLGSRMKTSNWSLSSLTSLVGAAPFGHLSSVKDAFGAAASPASAAPTVMGGRSWAWVVALVVGLGAIWWLSTRQTQTHPVSAPPAAQVSGSPSVTSPTEAGVATVVGQISAFLSGTDGAVPRAFSVSDLEFSSGSATLSPAAESMAKDLAATLAAHPTAQLRLEGHTDNVGSATVNQQLSLARAQALRTALIDNGVEAGRIEAVGMGASRPIASNARAADRSRNRRTEIWITKR